MQARDAGKPLAGKSTLNRLELTPVGASAESRYKKIVAHCYEIEEFFVRVFLQSQEQRPHEIVLDLDATDDPMHGNQLGRFFHGYYRNYCYLPLYIFCGEHLLCAKLRPSDIDASAGTVKELDRIVSQLRALWPGIRVIIRADSGFCRDSIMSWCEQNDVEYVLGLAKNDRLKSEIEPEMYEAMEDSQESGTAARVYRDFEYRTLDSWSRARRVIGKAEYSQRGENPRFIVTSLPKHKWDGAALHEDVYCARGDMENRIKEQQLMLFADRTSAATMRANQLRLWFASAAYLLFVALRQTGLKGTDFERAQCDTIRLKLLKIGARIRITFRKVWLAFSEAYPYQQLFEAVYENLRPLKPVTDHW